MKSKPLKYLMNGLGGALTFGSNPNGLAKRFSTRLVVIIFVLSVAGVQVSRAASATWSATPVSSDWNEAQNWVPMTIPNGPSDTATFGVSALRSVVLSANTTVGQITFSAGADNYSIGPAPNVTLTISGTGIANNSGKAQTLIASGDETAAGTIQFTGGATAGNATLIASSAIVGSPGGQLQFLSNSSGGTARVSLWANGTLDIIDHAFPAPVVTIGSLEGNGTVLLGANYLRVANIYARTEFSGTLQGGSGALTIGNLNTLVLSGTSSYSGSTGIQGGRLLVNTPSGAATGSGPISVISSSYTSVLGGNGTITSPVNVGVGGTLLAGDATVAAGGLTVSDNLNMNANGEGDIQIVLGPAGTHSTLHRTGGTWTFGSSVGFKIINTGAELGLYKGVITGLASDPGVNGSWYLEGFGIAGNFSYDGAGNVDLNLIQVPVAPKVISIESRKTHGSAGTLGIGMPLTGQPGVECRSGGANGDYTPFVLFNQVVYGGSATVTSGAASVTGSSFSGAATVNLTGVTNAQTITVTLSGVEMAGGLLPDTPLRLSFLHGDTNGDGFVNAGDALQTRNRSGQAADAANFRSDVNADGVVNSGDTIAVRSRSGTFLP